MLDGLGLTPDQETVYVALLDVSSATETELRARCLGTPVRPAIAALERAGLVSRLTGTPVRYAAAPPDVALELLARARLSVAQLAGRYRRARATTQPHEVIEVVTTREATVRRWEQLQRSARRQVRSFDRPPYVSPSTNPVEEEMLLSGVVYRCVYHPAGFALP